MVLGEQGEEGVLARDHLVDSQPALLLEAAEERAPGMDEELMQALASLRHGQHQPQQRVREDELLPQRRRQLRDLYLAAQEGEIVAARLHISLERLVRDRRAAVVDVAAIVFGSLGGEPRDELLRQLAERSFRRLEVARRDA